MKEFVLTQPYGSLEEMLNSAEVSIYKEELMQGDIESYAIVSRIGNRYDLEGDKLVDFALNPFYNKIEIANETIEEEKVLEKTNMKYFEIEKLIDAEVEKAVAECNAKHEQEIADLKAFHQDELANAKANAKAEILEKINA